MVAEGVSTSRVVLELAARYGVELPIASEVYGVVHEGRTAQQAYRGLDPPACRAPRRTWADACSRVAAG